MKKKFLLGAFILCSMAATAADEEFFFEEDVVTQRLEESVITTTGFDNTVRNTPKNITIITSDEIQERGAQTVAEVLRGTSSVIVKEMNGSEPQFDLRGQGANSGVNTLVLLDGVPLNSVNRSGYKTNQIPVDRIERIEVIPSGGSVLYGDGAIGGVINIITKRPENKKNYGQVGLEAGSYNYLKKSVLYGTSIGDKLSLEIDYIDKNKDGYRDKQKDDLESFGLRTRYFLEDGSIGFSYAHSNNDFRGVGSLSGDQVDDDRTQASYITEGNVKTDSYTLDFDKQITSNLKFNLFGNISENEYKSGTYDYTTESNYIKPQFKVNYGDENYIIFGGEYRYGETDISKSYSGARKVEKESFAGYLVNNYTYNDFTFTQGYRRQRVEYDGENIKYDDKKFIEDSYEITGSYNYSSTGTTYISYTRAFLTPNTDDVESWTHEGDMEPEIADTYEIGLKDSIGNTFISTSIFYIEKENEIYLDKTEIDSDHKYGHNRNYDGTTKRKGIELSLEHYFGKLTISESITYMDTEFKDDTEIAGIPNIKGNININYAVTEKLTLNNSLEYYGKSYANGDEKNEGEKVDDYILVGLSLKYDFGNGLVLNGGVNNLFNEKYYDYVGGVKTGENDNRYYYPAPERNFYAGVKYNF